MQVTAGVERRTAQFTADKVVTDCRRRPGQASPR